VVALSQTEQEACLPAEPRTRHGKRRITTDTALRLARYFGTSERFWLNLQDRYDIEVARDRLGETLDEIRPRAHA
jgi:antitoxin HigA-1